jgi:hypothetical protein
VGGVRTTVDRRAKELNLVTNPTALVSAVVSNDQSLGRSKQLKEGIRTEVLVLGVYSPSDMCFIYMQITNHN